MSPALIDIILFLILAFFAIKGLLSGFLRTVVSFAAVIVSWWLTATHPEITRPIIGLMMDPHDAAFGLVVRIATFALCFIAIQLVGFLLGNAMAIAGLGGIDKLAGLALGFATGVLVGCLPIGVVYSIPLLAQNPEVQDTLRQSTFARAYTPIVRSVVHGHGGGRGPGRQAPHPAAR